MITPLRVLFVEDSEDDVLLLLRELRRGGYQVEFQQVETASAMRTALDEERWDIVICDYSMPRFSAPLALAVLKESGLDLPFLIVSGTIGEEAAVTSLLAGAHDFLIKDQLARLIPAIERELYEAHERQKRREAERKLQESEERFRLIAENTLDLISIASDDGRYIYVNPSFEILLGYAAETFLARHTLDLIHPEDHPHLAAWPQYGRLEYRMRRASGEWLWVDAVRFPITMQGRSLRVIIGRDVTERKQTEVKLRGYIERLRTLHTIDRAILKAQSPEAICQIALEFIISQMTPWGASITLFDLEAGQGKVAASYSREGEPWRPGTTFLLKAFLRKDLEVLQAGKIGIVNQVSSLSEIPFGLRRMQMQGLRSYLVAPLLAQDELIGSLNLGADDADGFNAEQAEISREIADQLAIAIQHARYQQQIQSYAAELEQRVVERTTELQRAKDRIEAILNNSSDTIILTSVDAVIQQVNPAFYDLYGYASEDIFEHSLLDLVDPGDVAEVLEALSRSVNSSQPSRVEAACSSIDGAHFNTDIAIAPVSQEGKIQGLVCSVRDITQRKQAEDKLRRALEQEKELNELKSRFTSMVSHEFRTPLSVILTSAGMLQKYLDRMSEEKRRGHLQLIEVQVNHLVGLLDDVLTLSRAEYVVLEVSGEPLDLIALCSEIEAEIQQTTMMHHIEVAVTGEPKPISGDVHLMRQAITNLLSNAIKYSPEGGTVELSLIYAVQQTVLRVKDEGIGIPEEDQKRLFDTFHRAGNVGTIAGTGLGLAIVKRAVEAHGGLVDFVSEIGVGTTFTITIPVRAVIGKQP